MVRTLQEVKLGMVLSPSEDRLRAGGSLCDTRLKVQVLLHTCECCTHQPVSISFPQVCWQCTTISISKVLMSDGAGFSCEGAKGVSMMQHGHLTSLQLEAMHPCMICRCSHNCQAQGTLKLVQYVWIVGTGKYMVLC